jgi:hypothetical protein
MTKRQLPAGMSALGSKADICGAPTHVRTPERDICSALTHVRFGPKADIPLHDYKFGQGLCGMGLVRP